MDSILIGFWLWTLNSLGTAHPTSTVTPRSLTNNTIKPNIEDKTLQERSLSVTLDLTPVDFYDTTFYYTVQLPIETTHGSLSPNLIVDSGSDILWMLSTAVDPNVFPPTLHHFMPIGPQDCAPSVISYGTGSTAVQVGLYPQSVELDLDEIKLPHMHMGAAVWLRNQGLYWTHGKIDGILGMGMRPNSWPNEVSHTYPAFDRFTIDAIREKLVLGDESHLQLSDRVYSDLSSDDRWTINSDNHGHILFDSGSPYVTLAGQWADQWRASTAAHDWRYSEQGGHRRILLRCDGDPADITFKVSGETLIIPGLTLIASNIDATHEWCVGRVLESPPNSLSILGVPFFEQYITVFEMKYKKIGFAKPL